MATAILHCVCKHLCHVVGAALLPKWCRRIFDRSASVASKTRNVAYCFAKPFIVKPILT